MDKPEDQFVSRKEFNDWIAFHVKVQKDLMVLILSLKGTLAALNRLSEDEVALFAPAMRKQAELNPYVSTLQGILEEISRNRNPTPNWTDFDGTVQ